MAEVIQQKEDSVKKGKILLLALFITFSFFFNKNLGPFYPILENSLVLATIYSVITFFGFFWILSFKVNLRILSLILPQVVFLVFSQILFLDMFFDQTSGRLYETALMIVLLVVFFVLTHVVFLTSNIFAVSSFKKIPLEAVAKTTIYIISSLSIFFATYGFLNLEISTIFSIVLLLVFIFFSTVFVLSHFYLEMSTVFSNTVLVFWSVFLVLVGAVFFSSKVEFIALLLTMVFYFSVGLFISKREQISKLKIVEYIFLLILIVFFAFYFSLF
jgi:hypothetical protein